jgi:hypothetical protein
VQAGKKGNFGLTLGIARENNRKELEEKGLISWWKIWKL